MTFKTATSLAFAAACLAAAATVPAQAQTAGTYGNNGPQTYQSNPNWSGNPSNSPGGSAGTSGTEVVTNGPQATPGDMSPSWSARRNVIESQHYDRLLETNRGFRQARMHKECGPITDPQLRQDCLASFNQDEPAMGSSTPRRSYHSGYGR